MSSPDPSTLSNNHAHCPDSLLYDTIGVLLPYKISEDVLHVPGPYDMHRTNQHKRKSAYHAAADVYMDRQSSIRQSVGLCRGIKITHFHDSLCMSDTAEGGKDAKIKT